MNHKFLFFNLLLLFIPSFLLAQFAPVYVSGVVTNVSTSLPVTGANVYVTMDSVNGFAYYGTVVTDGSGGFTDTIWVNTYVPTANVVVSTSNCNGTMASQTFAYTPNAVNNFTANFSVNCQGGGFLTCTASFSYQSGAGNTMYFTNTSVGSSPSNPTSCAWTFSNGSTSNSNNPVVTFPNPGVFTACLVMTDTVSGCTDSTCQTFTITGGVNYNYIDVKASAVAPGAFAPDSFMVYLIQYDSLAGTLTAIDSATAIQGPNGGLATCSFNNLGSGDYFVKAAVSTLASPNYATSIPTYYTNGLFWSVATPITIPAALPASVTINMIQGVNPGGPGFIGGLVSQGANKTGIPNVEIMLLDMSDNPITYTYSNGSGSFSFSNIAYGTYKVYAEVIGRPTNPAIVTISAPTPSIGDVDVQINSTYVSTGVAHAVFFENNVSVYPNPTTENAFVQVDLKQNSNIVVEVTNVFGQLVQKIDNKLTTGTHSISLNTANWNAGVYFVKVTANGSESQVQKLIVE